MSIAIIPKTNKLIFHQTQILQKNKQTGDKTHLVLTLEITIALELLYLLARVCTEYLIIIPR